MPAFNEAGKIAGTLGGLRAALAAVPGGCEIVVSDDGSTDATAAEVEKASASDPRVRLVRNPHRGRGGALKAGLAAATGEIVVTIDADLSYGPGDVLRLFEHLQKYPGCDLVIGSCYMPGGKVEGVPTRRLWVSWVGNLLLRFAFHGRFHTTTGILRGYRREKLQALLQTLVSDGKELYLEFLHKALAAGWRVEEIPATLTWRRGPGGGSFSFLSTAVSHLGFLLARQSRFFLAMSVGLCLPAGFMDAIFNIRYSLKKHFKITVDMPSWMFQHDGFPALVQMIWLLLMQVGLLLVFCTLVAKYRSRALLRRRLDV
jgi:glycosyltransferase involved in cell wall biosynthesis